MVITMKNNFKQKLASFMYGRYGVDTLYWWSLGAIIVLWVLRLIFSILGLDIISSLLNLLSTAILVITVFRFFSKNIYKRSAENRKFNEFIGKHKGKFILIRDRFRDRKTNVYKACPHCKAMLRLPKEKGTHTVKCPKCSERFSVNIR